MKNENIKNIVFIEPQCEGIVHASLNALWIISFLKALGISQSILICEKTHFEQVNIKLIENNSSYFPSFVPITLNWSMFEHLKYFEEYAFIKKKYLNYVSNNTQLIIFLSTTRTMLIALKVFFNKHYYNKLIFAIPHAVLKEVEDPQSKRFWNFPYRVKRGINLDCPENLKFIAMTKPIYLNIVKHSYSNQWIHIDHPIPLPKKLETNTLKSIPNHLDKKLTIGIFGSINYDFLEYFNLLKEIKQLHPSLIEIKIVGHIIPKIFHQLDSSFIDYYSLTPISFKDYDRLARSIDIALWSISPQRTKFAASGTILDIFTYGIPVIYKENELLDYYSSLMGKVGFKINSSSEILDIFNNLIKNDCLDKSIVSFKENMKKINTLFSIDATSLKIKQIYNSNDEFKVI